MSELVDEFQVLLSSEAENYVASLTSFDIPEIGSARWFQQHEFLEKLNMQSVISASKDEDEFIKEFFTSLGKVPTLIHDLIVTEIWKQKIFPEIPLSDHNLDVIFPLYAVLYHEAIVVNLIETMLFHQEVCEAAGDLTIDLIDYCYHKLIFLCNFHHDHDENCHVEIVAGMSTDVISTVKELRSQDEKLNFDISMKAISILSYIINHLSVLSLACSECIFNTHDIPLLLVQLLEIAPWTKEKSGKIMKYVDAKWKEIEVTERPILVKIEGQIWISIFQLLVSTEHTMKFEMTSYKKRILQRLRPYLTEILLDQIPSLIELQHYLDQLTILDPPAVRKELIVEQIPAIKEGVIKKYEGHWTKIAQDQNQSFFSTSGSSFKCWATNLAATYSSYAFENLITSPPKCALCGHLATKRCSKCTNEWYCSRKCQISHWSKHKQPCNLLNEAFTRLKDSQTGV